MSQHTCSFCKSQFIEGELPSVHADGGFVCSACYWIHTCLFCKPPRSHSACPGHEINAKHGNRFLEDKAFVRGVDRFIMGDSND